MNKDELIQIFGTRANFAAAIGQGETTVRNWFLRGSIPARHDADIIKATKSYGRKITPTHLFEVRQSMRGEA